MKTPNTLDELLRFWDEHEPPREGKKGRKIVRCSVCGRWIREGKPYLIDAEGPAHIECFLGDAT